MLYFRTMITMADQLVVGAGSAAAAGGVMIRVFLHVAAEAGSFGAAGGDVWVR